MQRWRLWFFGRWGQLLFWATILVVGWLLVGPGSERARRWWPFQRSAPVVVQLPPGGSVPATGWTTVVKATRPAVVNISSAKIVRSPQGPPAPFSADPFFRFFFDQAPAPRRERSLGSGVIVTPDGYVLTNSHVVEGAQDIRVTLADRREIKAALVGADPRTDIAVLKLPGSTFPVAPVEDSSRVEVAEIVLAMGNPFGLSQTVTMGIVSAVGRSNVGITDYEDFIQTDAAINPGNSGGALVNARGGLVGINTAIFTQSGGYMGIGFAVPVNMARQVMDQLVTRGRLSRGYLGVSVQELTPSVARSLGIPNVRGVLVADVAPDGPAARASLRRGDVIASIDGKPVDDVGHFRNLVASTAPGTGVRLTVVRDGQEQAVAVKIDEAKEPAAVTSASAPVATPVRARPDQLGLVVVDATPEVAQKLGLPPNTQGAVVAEVAPGGLAAEAGLRPGDVILEVHRQPVRSARDFVRAFEQTASQDLLVLVNRAGRTAYVAIERAA
jgi:Do/DeqQ family serine protease